MNVYISAQVDRFIKEFYVEAMNQHITLDEPVVVAKVKRMYASLRLRLSVFPFAYTFAKYKTTWKMAKYRVIPIEHFQFAYKVYEDESGERFVVVQEVCYDKDYHD